MSARAQGAVVAACAVAAVVAGGSAAYAANAGGIQRTVQVWLHGDLTSATMVVDEGAGSYELYDASGAYAGGGGGIAYEPDGTMRPLTADELGEGLANEVSTERQDGRLYLLYKGQRLDVTDSFGQDGYCYVTLRDGDETLYATVDAQGGVATSPDRYPIPGKDFE